MIYSQTTNGNEEQRIKVYSQKDIDELLKYKNAWEELKQYIMTLETQLRHKNWAECERVMFVGTNNARLKIEELEQSNGIEVK